MKKAFLICLILILPTCCFASKYMRAVTYEMGSRTGDNVLAYSHAKWISYSLDIPLYYKPFPNSDQFVFHEIETLLTPEIEALYDVVMVNSVDQLKAKIKKDTLFVIRFFPDSYDEHISLAFFNGTPYIPVNWDDPVFKDMMVQLIQPRFPLNMIYPPKDIVSVALHYRNGGGYDSDYLKGLLPLRFVPDSYYIEQLHHLHDLVGNVPMYVQIFTDYHNPVEIKQKFEKEFSNKVKFVCREQGNHYNSNILEDMFSMTNFDCLVRAVSHYSITSSHVGDFKIEIYPQHRHGDVVDRVMTVQKAVWNQKTKKWSSI